MAQVEKRIAGEGFEVIGRHLPTGLPQYGTLVVTDPGVAATGHPQRIAEQIRAYGVEAEVFDAGTPQDVTSVRAKSQRHGKSTADKWNQ